jgi:hypothetical protein
MECRLLGSGEQFRDIEPGDEINRMNDKERDGRGKTISGLEA